MRIKNLRIDSFGKLNSVNIGLDDRITVISGKNEAGKSSIATFIKYMLYGFDSSKKADVAENQKKKYMPWDGTECSGEMDFVSADGKMYTAARKTAARSQNTVFDENNMPLTSDNAGDYFLGINENAYKKTAFIGQSDAVFTDDGGLDSAIRNMVYSADESVDSRKALKKLEDLRKYYLGKSGKSGVLFELENELSHLTAEREKWQNGHKQLLGAEYQLSEIQKKIAFNKQKKEELTRERQNLEYYEARNKLSQIENQRKKVEEGKTAFEEHYKLMQNGAFIPDEDYARGIRQLLSDMEGQKKHINECVSNVKRAKENLDGIYLDETQRNISRTLESENETAFGLLEKISQIKAARKTAKTVAVILTCLVITFPIAVFFYVKASRLSKELSGIAEKYGCRSIDALEKKLEGDDSFKNIEETAKRYYDDALRTLEAGKAKLSELASALNLLSEKGGFDVNETEEYLKKLEVWIKKTDELKRICREDYVTFNALVSDVDMDELSDKASRLDTSVEIRDIKTVTQQLSFYTQANDALIPKQMELEKQAAVLSNTLPKPAEIQSRILSLSEQRREMKQKHASLSLAIESLERASENMKSEAAPKIASETSSLFSKITDGKYKALYADGEMNLTFLENGEAEVRDAGYLSTGTLDAAYISLRIALCEFLYKEHPTLIFDDAFSNMDNERLERTLVFLTELSEDFQIVILSCHDREKEYLKDKAIIIDFAV